MVSAYKAPAGSLYLATNGSDANPGSVTRPLRTLKTALAKVKAGQTIVVRQGVYRQGIADPGSAGYPQGTLWTVIPAKVTIQSYPGETVWFDGTDVTKGWQRTGTHWSLPWSTPTFCGAAYYTKTVTTASSPGPCYHQDMLIPGTATGSPQMVFLNGKPVKEVPTLAKLTSTTFYYDRAAKRLHVGFDPTGKTVEASKRAQAMALYKTSGLSIKGIGFRRYGSNQFTNATSGAVALNAVTGALIERSSFVENAGGGLLTWQARGLTVRSSYLSRNGYNGMLGDGSRRQAVKAPSLRDDVVVENSRFDGNNTDGFGVYCTASCSAAGAKFSMMIGFTLRGNSFSRNGGNRAAGFWCDMACTDARIYGNAFVGNASHGLLYEISDRGTIASNYMAGNGFIAKGSGLMVSAANTRILNNTIAGNYNNVLLYDDDRVPSSTSGPNTMNVTFDNNVIATGDYNRPQVTLRAGSTAKAASNTRPSAFMSYFDYNSYYRPTASSRWWLNWEQTQFVNGLYDAPTQLAATRKPLSAHDKHLRTSTDPFFVRSSTGDYRLRSATIAGAGRTLPADVATMLGVPTSPVYRGALSRPGFALPVQPPVG